MDKEKLIKGGMWISGSGGFNLIATNPTGQAFMGAWSNLGTNVQQSGSELTHSSDASRSWGADWTAPSSGSGDVKFSIAVLFGNGNNQNSQDSWGTNQITLNEAAGQSNTPPLCLKFTFDSVQSNRLDWFGTDIHLQ